MHTVVRPHTDSPLPQPQSSPTSWLPQKQNTSVLLCSLGHSEGSGPKSTCAWVRPTLVLPLPQAGQLTGLALISPPSPPFNGQKRGFMDTLHQSWLSQLLVTETPPQRLAPPHPPCLPHSSSQGSCSHSSTRGWQLAPPGHWSPPGHTGTEFLLSPSSPHSWELKTAFISSIVAPGVSTGHTHALHRGLYMQAPSWVGKWNPRIRDRPGWSPGMVRISWWANCMKGQGMGRGEGRKSCWAIAHAPQCRRCHQRLVPHGPGHLHFQPQQVDSSKHPFPTPAWALSLFAGVSELSL